MKKISLTKGLFATVDDEDFNYLNQWKWYANKCGSKYRVMRKTGSYKLLYMHRFILKASQNMQVDHINGDSLDNRRSNLRLATNAQNSANRKTIKSLIGYRGVTRNGYNYSASITVNRKHIHLGTFSTAIEAAKVYDRNAILNFGEYACLNFKLT